MSPSPVIQPPVLPLAHVIFLSKVYSSVYVIFTDVEAAKEYIRRFDMSTEGSRGRSVGVCQW